MVKYDSNILFLQDDEKEFPETLSKIEEHEYQIVIVIQRVDISNKTNIYVAKDILKHNKFDNYKSNNQDNQPKPLEESYADVSNVYVYSFLPNYFLKNF